MNSELLSRIAETLYWTGRYVERADDTARLIDAYVHRMLGAAGGGSDAECRALFGILGVDADAGLDVGAVLFRLVYDTHSPSAIAGAVLGARAGVRGIREVISSEMWECLNVTALALPGQKRAAERLAGIVWTSPDRLFLAQLAEHLGLSYSDHKLRLLEYTLQGRAADA